MLHFHDRPRAKITSQFDKSNMNYHTLYNYDFLKIQRDRSSVEHGNLTSRLTKLRRTETKLQDSRRKLMTKTENN